MAGLRELACVRSVPGGQGAVHYGGGLLGGCCHAHEDIYGLAHRWGRFRVVQGVFLSALEVCPSGFRLLSVVICLLSAIALGGRLGLGVSAVRGLSLVGLRRASVVAFSV